MPVGEEGLMPSYMNEAINEPATPRRIANMLEMARAVTGLALTKSKAL